MLKQYQKHLKLKRFETQFDTNSVRFFRSLRLQVCHAPMRHAACLTDTRGVLLRSDGRPVGFGRDHVRQKLPAVGRRFKDLAAGYGHVVRCGFAQEAQPPKCCRPAAGQLVTVVVSDQTPDSCR